MALSPPKSKLPPIEVGEPALTAKEITSLPPTVVEPAPIPVNSRTGQATTNIVKDITKEAHCLRCGVVFPKADWKMTTIGNPETGQLFTYRPLCASCIEAIKPTGDNMKQQ